MEINERDFMVNIHENLVFNLAKWHHMIHIAQPHLVRMWDKAIVVVVESIRQDV